MKLIRIPKAIDFIEEDAEAYVEGYGAGAQAQLEACEEEHKTIVQEIFEEIESHSFAEPIQVPEYGREPIIICIPVEDWQALKERLKK